MTRRPPGLVSRDEDPDVVLMIGTAGHVDHGKTRLVRFLTGCETDRLREEKERGLSIELGFAPCRIGADLSVGIVDVPGHEQFIKNMVAGASGMDLVVLVVAADDGVMPQTVEHLQIMEFLGVQNGLVVISKTDLVPSSRVEEVKKQVEELTQETFLANAPICPVSTETFEGFETFYETLVEMVQTVKIQRREGVFRMPVERVFSVPGLGTVATGIPKAGRIAVGDELEVQPGNQTTRVRGLERFKKRALHGGAGQCLALNLAGLPHDAVMRGSVLGSPGYVESRSLLEVMLTACVTLSKPLRNGEEVRFHTGTLEAFGKLRLYDKQHLAQRESGFGAIQLHDPVPASPTDRFVLRLNSPVVTVGGGVILNTLDRAPHESRPTLAQKAAERWRYFASAESRFEYFFIESGFAGGRLTEAAKKTLLPLSEAENVATELVKNGRLHKTGSEGCYLHQSGRDAAFKEILGFVETHHTEHPDEVGPILEDVAGHLGIPDSVRRVLVDELVSSSKLERFEKRIGLPGGTDRFDTADREILNRIESLYRERGFATPRPDELPQLVGTPANRATSLLDYLCESGRLIRLGKNVIFHKHWMEEAERRVVSVIAKDGSLDSADFKTTIDSSRKYALAILDFFDTVHITHRFGNKRVLHPAYLKSHPDVANG